MSDTKQAVRILAEIQEARQRAERSLSAAQQAGSDHFRQRLAMARETLDERSLDRYSAHAGALAASLEP